MIQNGTDKTIFLSLLRNGQGLTKACKKMGYDPKEASEYLNDTANSSLSEEVDNAFKLGLIDAISKREKAIKSSTSSTDSIAVLDAILDKFISQPVYWGDGLNEYQREELEDEEGMGVIPITDEMVIQGLARFGNLYEVATAYGQQYNEIIEIVAGNSKLRYLLRK